MLLVVVLAVGLLVAQGAGGSGGVRAGALGRARVGARAPLAAEGLLSRRLGGDDRAYLAARAGGGWVLGNAVQRLRARFDRRGVVVRSGGAWLGLRLSGLGFGGALHAVRPVSPWADANRVVYRHRGVLEWYANGPLGLEQGFTLAARPEGRHGGSLALALALSGNLRGTLAFRGDGVSFTGAGVSLAYRGLVATDARGRRLRARIELRGGGLVLRVDDRGARYPLRVDPFVQQAKLTGADGGANDQLGGSVALSGNTAVVAANDATVNGKSGQGAVYVFTRSGSSWSQQAKLTASDGAAGDHFGNGVALSGNTVVVGAPQAAVNGATFQGAAYVFTESAGSWSQQAKLTASDGAADDGFGQSVAVDGNTVVVGASGETLNGHTGQGAMYVFTESAGSWSQQAKLTASDGAAFDEFGGSVAVAGSTIVAAGGHAAYVFTGSAGSWSQQAKLTAADGAIFDIFNEAVGVSGNTVVAGAPYENAVYVFTETAGSWSQAKLTTAGAASLDHVGESVAVAGNTVVAGAPYTTTNGHSDQGAVYVFTETAGSWSQAKLTASDGAAGDLFGDWVTVSADTVLAGAPKAAVKYAGQGAAYAFLSPDPTATSMGCSPATVALGQPTTCTATVTDTAASPVTPTGSVSLALDTATALSCRLAPSTSTAQASCSVSYTPEKVGTEMDTARYSGDSNHLTSIGGGTVTVTNGTTVTSLSCTATKTPARRCTATVTDTAAGKTITPSGTVTFTTTSRHGRFTPNPCTLSGTGRSASCTVTYKPATGTQTITASYTGDSTHLTSTGTTHVAGPGA